MTDKKEAKSKLELLLISCLFVFLFFGCASETTRQPMKIDLTNEISKCTVFKDHIECSLYNGDIYYAEMDKLVRVTEWHCSAWGENPC